MRWVTRPRCLGLSKPHTRTHVSQQLHCGWRQPVGTWREEGTAPVPVVSSVGPSCSNAGPHTTYCHRPPTPPIVYPNMGPADSAM